MALFPDDAPLRALGGMFVADLLADVLKIFAYIAVSLTLVYSRSYLAARGLFRGETFVLALLGAARHDGDDLGQQLRAPCTWASS